MKAIKENIINELIIKNSKFITLLIKIDSSNIKKILEEIKITYPKATHYCYAFIFNDVKHSSDDGEPSSTAGMPILNVIEKENLNNILVVVVRYFGGIKLGAGGLIRAYTKSVTEALKETTFIELINGYKVEITFPYSEEKQINYILNNNKILNKEYNELISYQVLIPVNKIDLLKSYNYKILENLYIEKSSD
jgi:uncharacterized YigZ family protein